MQANSGAITTNLDIVGSLGTSDTLNIVNAADGTKYLIQIMMFLKLLILLPSLQLLIQQLLQALIQ